MPFTIPSLSTVRANNRDYIAAKLPGVSLIPNDYPRVLADANAGNAHLNLQYLQWLSLQLLPDTAQAQFLDKWATLFLVNSDGSIGRQVATYSSGTASMTASVAGTLLPAGTQFTVTNGSVQILLETIAATAIGISPTSFAIRSLTSGVASILPAGTTITVTAAIPGLSASSATIVSMTGGDDAETDTALQARVLAAFVVLQWEETPAITNNGPWPVLV